MKPKRELAQKSISKSRKQTKGINAKVFALALIAILFLGTQNTFAHCDSYDGPVIKEAQQALATNNVNLVLKWVSSADEPEITSLFKKTNELKKGDKEVYAIVEKHFLETLVRLHRATEGVGYTGLKPAGSASPIIIMADNAIETKSIDDLLSKFTAHIEKVVREKFVKVQDLSLVKNESLEKGRAYVAAYVDYTHTLEEMHGIIEHGPEAHQH
ncbi:MAG: DUF6448 family protein [Candidatus Saccharimonadaceae bacterium]